MRPELPSRAPYVVDKLLELFNAAFPAGTQLIDGPHLGDDSALSDDVVLVGHGTETDPGVSSNFREAPGLGRKAYVEDVETVCFISSFSGDTEMKPRRDRVAELLAAVKTVLDDNQVVPDVWDQVKLGPEVLWYPIQTAQGATCAVGFTVWARSMI